MARYNRIPNPTGQIDLTGWIGTGDRTQATGLVGPPRPYGGFVSTTAEAWGASIGPARATVGVNPGDTWSGVIWVRHSAARTIRINAQLTNSGAYVDDVLVQDVAVAANTWTEVNISGVLPAGTYNEIAIIANIPTAGTAGVLTLSSGRLEEGNYPALDYADGNSGDGWVWDGTSGLSTSTQPDIGPPIVGAGADATVNLGNDFERVATENANGAGISARGWRVVSAPVGGPSSGTVLSGSTALDYTPPVQGTYVLEYFATNSQGTSADQVTVTVNVQPPVANAGADISFHLGNSFNRNGTETGGGITFREWSVQAGPSNVGAVLSSSPGVSWTPPAIGAYTLRYRVTNSQGTDDDTVVVTTTAPPTPPEDVPDGWTYVNVPWGDNTFTLRDLPPGVDMELQIRAVDAANPPNSSPFSPSLVVGTPQDDIAPSIPAVAEVAASRNAVMVKHNLGRSTGGTSNLESDLVALRVHLVANPEQAVNNTAVEVGGTLLGQMEANIGHLSAEVPVVATFPIPQVTEVWIRVTAVDAYGNESLPSAAAPVTAELLSDAYIANLTVDKITSGRILSEWVQAAEMNSGEEGARFRLGYFGLEFYNDDNQLTLDANTSDGSLYLVGTISTAVSGRRVVIDGQQNRIAFTPQSTDTRQALIYSYVPSNFPNDVALELRAVDSDETDVHSRLYLLPDTVSMLVSPNGDGGDLVATSQVRVSDGLVFMQASNIDGTAPYVGADEIVRSRMQVQDTGEVGFESRTTDGSRRARIYGNNTGIYGIAETAGTRDGGYITLERTTGTVQLGRQTIAGLNSFLDIADDGDFNIWRNGTLRVSAMEDGVELLPYAYTQIIDGYAGGRVQFGADDGPAVFFYWAGGQCYVGSGSSIVVNLSALHNANLINRMNTAETNINTLFTYAHGH